MKKVFILLMVLLTMTFFVGAQDQQAPAADDTVPTDQTGDTTGTAEDAVQPQDQLGAESDQAAEDAGQSAAVNVVANQKLSVLIGYNIVNSEGNVIGEVKDFVITSDGKIPYAVVDLVNPAMTFPDAAADPATGDSSDTLGTGDPAVTAENTEPLEDILIPLRHITFATGEDAEETATISVDLNQLQGAPALGDDADNRLGSGWEQSTESFWSGITGEMGAEGDTADAATDTAVQTGSGQAYLASEILDYGVKGNEDANIGNVKDILVDLENGQVGYVAIGVGGFLGIGERLYAIPLDAFQVNQEDEDLVLGVGDDFFDDTKGFDKDAWPTEASDTWQEDVLSQKAAEEAGDNADDQNGTLGAEDNAAVPADGDTGSGPDPALESPEQTSGAAGQTDNY